MRTILFAIIIALPVAAQFNDLATSANGEVLFFSSPLRQVGTNQPGHGKIFRATEAGIELVKSIERVPQGPFDIITGTTYSNYHDARLPQVDPSGRLIAFSLGRVCNGPGCLGYFPWQTYWNGSIFDGEALLSANGKYMAITARRAGLDQLTFVTEIETGRKWGPVSTGNALPMVGDDGSLLVNYSQRAANRFLFWTPPGSVEQMSLGLTSLVGMGQAMVVEEGDPVAYVLRGFGEIVLSRVDLKTRRSEDVLHGVLPCSQLQIKSRRRFFAICEDKQVWAFENNGRFGVTTEPGGVSAYIVSADGQVIWYVASSGALKKLSRGSGKVTTVVRPPASWSVGSMVPGSVARIVNPNGDLSINGAEKIRVRINGQDAPVLRSDKSGIVFQVPWELDADGPNATAEVDLAGLTASELESAVRSWPVMSFNPFFVALNDEGIALVHGDWRGLVTSADPAVPGEVVHAYMSGLGRVEGPVSTGVAAPADTVHRIQRKMACYINDVFAFMDWPMETIYAGLAPGTVGLYQLSLRVRSDGRGGWLFCDERGPTLPLLVSGPGGPGAATTLHVRRN